MTWQTGPERPVPKIDVALTDRQKLSPAARVAHESCLSA